VCEDRDPHENRPSGWALDSNREKPDSGADVKTISGTKIEHHARAAEFRPPAVDGFVAIVEFAAKRAMVSPVPRPDQEERVSFMGPAWGIKVSEKRRDEASLQTSRK
jgi:hypothetical protein